MVVMTPYDGCGTVQQSGRTAQLSIGMIEYFVAIDQQPIGVALLVTLNNWRFNFFDTNIPPLRAATLERLIRELTS